MQISSTGTAGVIHSQIKLCQTQSCPPWCFNVCQMGNWLSVEAVFHRLMICPSIPASIFYFPLVPILDHRKLVISVHFVIWDHLHTSNAFTSFTGWNIIREELILSQRSKSSCAQQSKPRQLQATGAYFDNTPSAHKKSESKQSLHEQIMWQTYKCINNLLMRWLSVPVCSAL